MFQLFHFVLVHHLPPYIERLKTVPPIVTPIQIELIIKLIIDALLIAARPVFSYYISNNKHIYNTIKRLQKISKQ